ncbi:MAG: hypothetical protein H5T86_08780 [Armatimonadetes bacterium]|nr:hypothetical protein [Armatimonadota bacterium]
MWVEKLLQLPSLPASVRGLLRFVCTRMQRSYKPVLFQIFVSRLPSMEFPMHGVVEEFCEFYRDRARKGLVVERRPCVFLQGGIFDEDACAARARDIIRLVFARGQGLLTMRAGQVQLAPQAGWDELKDPSVRVVAIDIAKRALAEFYRSIEYRGEGAYAAAAERSAGSVLVLELPSADDENDLLPL